MNSVQYEELSRFFLAATLGLPIDRVLSMRIPNPKRPDLPEYKHQIDLYWETEDAVNKILCIANAKWRSTGKVDLQDVLLLQIVKEKVAAHKAMIITNSSFTAGAIAAAKDHGIGLHVVKPTISENQISASDRSAIQNELENLSHKPPNSLFTHEIVHKAFDLRNEVPSDGRPVTGGTLISRRADSITTKVVSPSTNRALGSSSITNRGLPPPQRGGPKR